MFSSISSSCDVYRNITIGVGAIFDPRGGGATAFWGPIGVQIVRLEPLDLGASNKHNLACLHCTLFDGAHLAYFSVLMISNWGLLLGPSRGHFIVLLAPFAPFAPKNQQYSLFFGTN